MSDDLAEHLREKMRGGNYASESDIIADGLAALDEREAEIENWLREDVARAYDAWRADPSRAIPIDEAFARLDARIAADRSKPDRR